MSGMGGGSGPPPPPPFHPMNIKGIAASALNTDLARYFSYQFPVFPGMNDLRQKEIQDAYKQLTSPLSADFSNQFLNTAQTQQQTITGSGDQYSGMALGQPDSFNKGAVSASYTKQAMAKQDYDRTRLEGLVQQNPVPGLGLSQSDLFNMYLYNTGAANANAMSNYANAIAAAQAQFNSEQQMWSGIGNAVGGIGNAYTNYNMYQNLYGTGSINFGADAGVI